MVPAFGRFGIVVIGIACLAIPQLIWHYRDRVEEETGNRFDRVCEAMQAVRTNQAGRPPFVDVTDKVGLDFQHYIGPLGTYFLPEITGAGGALFDYDNDGDLDVYLLNSGRSPEAKGDFPAGTRIKSRLFRQDSGLRFIDVTEESGLGNTGYGNSCAIGDIDNDGDLDVYQTNYGSDFLFQNNGDSTFRDITKQAGIENNDWGTGCLFLDFDRDGRLDLFVVTYVSDPTYGHSVGCGYHGDRVTYCGPRRFVPSIARLLHNEGMPDNASAAGSVRFTDVTERAGFATVAGAGFAAVSADFNRDGWPDIYVANDLNPNRLWINGTDGTFRDEGLSRGAAVTGLGAVLGSMGIALGDVDNNGFADLLVSTFTHEPHSLFLNDGSGFFQDATRPSKLESVTSPHTGWGTAFLDLDHDGDLDLPLVNGLITPCDLTAPTDAQQNLVVRREVVEDPQAFWSDYQDRNLMLINDGRGQFVEISAGDFTAQSRNGRSLLYGDIDNDGDLDLLVTYCGDRARLYRNDVSKQGHWLQIRAWDPALRRDAYGAEVTVMVGQRRFLRIVNPADSYLASNDVRAHFGLGHPHRYDAIEVRWPDGLVEHFPAGSADRLVVLNRGQGSLIKENER